MTAYGVNDAIAAIARNTNFGDNGDRLMIGEFLGRDMDAPDPFGPLPETEADRAGDDVPNDNKPSGTPTPANVRKPTNSAK